MTRLLRRRQRSSFRQRLLSEDAELALLWAGDLAAAAVWLAFIIAAFVAAGIAARLVTDDAIHAPQRPTTIISHNR